MLRYLYITSDAIQTKIWYILQVVAKLCGGKPGETKELGKEALPPPQVDRILVDILNYRDGMDMPIVHVHWKANLTRESLCSEPLWVHI